MRHLGITSTEDSLVKLYIDNMNRSTRWGLVFFLTLFMVIFFFASSLFSKFFIKLAPRDRFNIKGPKTCPTSIENLGYLRSGPCKNLDLTVTKI